MPSFNKLNQLTKCGGKTYLTAIIKFASSKTHTMEKKMTLTSIHLKIKLILFSYFSQSVSTFVNEIKSYPILLMSRQRSSDHKKEVRK